MLWGEGVEVAQLTELFTMSIICTAVTFPISMFNKQSQQKSNSKRDML